MRVRPSVVTRLDTATGTISARGLAERLDPVRPLTLLNGSPDLAAIPRAELAALARLASGAQMARRRLPDRPDVLRLRTPDLRRGDLPVSVFPRFLGLLYGRAGACYIANSYADFLAPSLLSPYILYPCLLGEGALSL
jgi:hypothetical protein